MNGRYITKAQLEEIEKAFDYSNEERGRELLRKYAGIEAVAYTAYSYYDEDGNFLRDDEDGGIDIAKLLDAAYVEVKDDECEC